MSTIYIGERQSGKTTMLIEMSEKTGATIVVATYPMALMPTTASIVRQMIFERSL